MSTTKSVIDVNGIRYELAHLLGRGGQGAVYAVKGGRLAVKLVAGRGPNGRERIRNHLTHIRRLPLRDLALAKPLEMLRPPHTGYVMELLTGMVPIKSLLAPPPRHGANGRVVPAYRRHSPAAAGPRACSTCSGSASRKGTRLLRSVTGQHLRVGRRRNCGSAVHRHGQPALRIGSRFLRRRLYVWIRSARAGARRVRNHHTDRCPRVLGHRLPRSYARPPVHRRSCQRW